MNIWAQSFQKFFSLVFEKTTMHNMFARNDRKLEDTVK